MGLCRGLTGDHRRVVRQECPKRLNALLGRKVLRFAFSTAPDSGCLAGGAGICFWLPSSMCCFRLSFLSRISDVSFVCSTVSRARNLM